MTGPAAGAPGTMTSGAGLTACSHGARLKQFRPIAPRYEKSARNDLAMIHIGCLRIRAWV